MAKQLYEIRDYGAEGRVTSVRPTWTPDEWFRVIAREGDVIPICCGNISAARDRLISAIADDGWISAMSLVDIVANLSSHDGFEGLFEDPETYEKSNPGDLLLNLAYAWRNTKDRLGEFASDQPRRQVSPLEQAWSDLSSMSLYMSFGNEDPVYCTYCISRATPALKTLQKHVGTYFPNGPVTYFAVVMEDAPDEFVVMRRGPAIFKSLDAVKETATLWTDTTGMRVRKITCSPEGFELHGSLDPLP